MWSSLRQSNVALGRAAGRAGFTALPVCSVLDEPDCWCALMQDRISDTFCTNGICEYA